MTSLIPDDEVHYHTDLFGPDGLFPRHGPYGPGRTEAAASLMVELARYLNYATQQTTALPYPSTVGRVWSSLASTVRTVDQTMTQTCRRLTVLADDGRAYVDDLPRLRATAPHPREAAAAAVAAIEHARVYLDDGAGLIADAASHAGRIGLRDPESEDNDRG